MKRGACALCRRYHKSCDGQRPCSRCVQLKKDCLDVPLKKVGRPKKNPVPQEAQRRLDEACFTSVQGQFTTIHPRPVQPISVVDGSSLIYALPNQHSAVCGRMDGVHYQEVVQLSAGNQALRASASSPTATVQSSHQSWETQHFSHHQYALGQLVPQFPPQPLQPIQSIQSIPPQPYYSVSSPPLPQPEQGRSKEIKPPHQSRRQQQQQQQEKFRTYSSKLIRRERDLFSLSGLLPSSVDTRKPMSIMRPHLVAAASSASEFWRNMRLQCLHVNVALCKMLRFTEEELLGWRKASVFDITDDFHEPTRNKAMQLLALKPKPKIFPVLANTLRYTTRDGCVIEAQVRFQAFSTDGEMVSLILITTESYRCLSPEEADATPISTTATTFPVITTTTTVHSPTTPTTTTTTTTLNNNNNNVENMMSPNTLNTSIPAVDSYAVDNVVTCFLEDNTDTMDSIDNTAGNSTFYDDNNHYNTNSYTDYLDDNTNNNEGLNGGHVEYNPPYVGEAPISSRGTTSSLLLMDSSFAYNPYLVSQHTQEQKHAAGGDAPRHPCPGIYPAFAGPSFA